MPYESPIEITEMVNKMCDQIVEEKENQIVAFIREQYHVDCNREELIKALNYDRQQYEKGYEDARRQFHKEVESIVFSMPLQDAVHNYLLTHTTSELLEVVLEAIKEYER